MANRKVVVTIAPSADKLRCYLDSALAALEQWENEPETCLPLIKSDLLAAREYLSIFDAGDEVLIPAFTRIKGHIGQKRPVGEFDCSDFSYREMALPAASGKPGETDSTVGGIAIKDVRRKR